MNKVKYIFGISLLLLSSCTYAKDISIFINDKAIVMDVQPEKKRNTTYVPISFIGKELGANVEWTNPNVLITKDNTTIICSICSNIASKNGKQISLLSPPYLLNGRTFVPLRFVSEQLNCTVSYDNINKIIYINSTNTTSTNTPPTNISPTNISPTEDKNFSLSSNTSWGVKRDLVYSSDGAEYIIYLKDMNTNLISELYSTTAFCRAEWLNDNRLLLSGVNDVLGGPDRKHIMIYNPENGQTQNIADADSFEYIKDLNAIIYFKRNPSDDRDLIGSNCKLYFISDNITDSITQEQYTYYCSLL